MAIVGLFDFQERCQQLQAKGDPLERLNLAIPWEKFRSTLEKVHEEGTQGQLWSQAFLRDPDVQGVDPAIALQPFRRAHRISDPRPHQFHAVPGPHPERSGARRKNHLVVQR